MPCGTRAGESVIPSAWWVGGPAKRNHGLADPCRGVAMQIGAVFQPGFRCRCGVTNGSPMLWGAAFGRTLGHWTTPGVTTRLRGRLCLGCGSVYMDMPEQGSRFSWGASPFVSGFFGWAVGPLCSRWAELRVRRVLVCRGQRFVSVRCILACVCVCCGRPATESVKTCCVCVLVWCLC